MNGHLSFAVVADDLTGACDCGVQFVKTRHQTIVRFDETDGFVTGDENVVVIDTETRHLEPSLAFQKLFDIGLKVKQACIVYKKIDSALRGPIAEETIATFESTGRRTAILAPAFPSQGRTTINGVHLLYGKPIIETEFARDPLTPVRQSHLPSLLKEAGIGHVGFLSVQDLTNKSLVHDVLDNYQWITADAETDQHLENLVNAVQDPTKVLWVGSAGLAQALARIYPGQKDNSNISLPKFPLRTVAIVGSDSQVARRQIDYAIKQPDVVEAVLPISYKSRESKRWSIQNTLNLAREGLNAGKPVVVFPVEDQSYDLKWGENDPEMSYLIVSSLAEIAAQLAQENLVDALILSGGDTTLHVARRLENWGISLLGELEPGVPLGSLLGEKPIIIATKAGSFGKEGTLLNSLNMFVSPRGLCHIL